MNVLSLFSRAHPTHTVLFDIGSATVGVAIAKYHAGHPIEILFTHREFIKYTDGVDVAESLRVAVENAGNTAVTALGALGRHGVRTYSVQAIAHAPWIDSYSTRIESGLKTETTITRALLQKFMRDKLPQTQVANRIQCDYHVTKIELNGYHTMDPYQKKAQHVALTILQSTMAIKVHEALRTAYGNVFPNHEVHIDAFLFAITQLQDVVTQSNALSILDIGGEYTTLHVIQDGVAVASIGIDFGTEHVLRTLMDGTQLNRQAALSELGMYLANTCTPSQCRKIETALERADAEWVRVFGDACTTLHKTHRIPNTLHIVGNTRVTKWFTAILARMDFATFTTTGQPLEPSLVSLGAQHREVGFRGGAKADTVLALLALFVDK